MMTTFIFPTATDQMSEEGVVIGFLGVGRYATTFNDKPKDYDVADPDGDPTHTHAMSEYINQEYQNDEIPRIAYQNLRGIPEDYLTNETGYSKDLAYSLCLVSRHIGKKRELDFEIWCTGEIRFENNLPTLRTVNSDTFRFKLEDGFLNDSESKLFIVPANNLDPNVADRPTSEDANDADGNLRANLRISNIITNKNAEIINLETLEEYIKRDYFNPDNFKKNNSGKKIILKVQINEFSNLVDSLFLVERGSNPNPYKSLSSFEINDKNLFFGRNELSNLLYERYKKYSISPGQLRLLPIVGPSGSGKSSLAKAGLLATIKDQDRTEIITFTPTSNPIFTFIRSIENIFYTQKGIPKNKEKNYVEWINNVDGRGLIKIFQDIQTNGNQNYDSFLIFIDQFEELHLSVDKKQFIQNLYMAISDPCSSIFVVFTLRSDFLGGFVEDENIGPSIKHNKVFVSPMSYEELKEVITEPARKSGMTINPKLADELISETIDSHDGTGLPLLEFSLTQMFDIASDKGTSFEDAYDEIGGITGSLASEAQRIYESHNDEDKQIIERIFTYHLVTPGKGTFDTKRSPVLLKDILTENDDAIHIMKLLYTYSTKKCRFLTFSSSNTKSSEYEITVQITHDALIKNWDTLGKWISFKREDIMFFHELIEGTKNWQENDKLWDGLLLDSLKAFYQKFKKAQVMTKEQIEFYKYCIRKETVGKILKWCTIAIIILLLILAWWQKDKLKEQLIQSNHNYGRLLLEKAQIAVSSKDFNEAHIFSLNALKFLNPLDREKIIQTKDIVVNNPVHPIIFKSPHAHHKDTIFCVDFSLDGETLTSVSGDGEIVIWSVKTGEKKKSFKCKIDSSSIALSPDGKTLATIPRLSNTITLWNLETGEQRNSVSLNGYSDNISDITFSPDGKTIATTSFNGQIIIWDLKKNQQRSSLKWNKNFKSEIDFASSIAFSPNGKMLALASHGGEIVFWNIETDEQPITLERVVENISDIDFSIDENTLAAASHDGVIIFYDLKTGKQIIPIPGDYKTCYMDINFSPDGKTLVTASRGGIITLWNLETNEPINPFDGHCDDVFDVAFSPNEEILASASNDGKIILWNLETGEQKILSVKFVDDFTNIEFSPDGSTLASASEDGTVIIWDVKSGEPKSHDNQHFREISDLVFTPDGKTLASVSFDGSLILWDSKSGAKINFISLKKYSEDSLYFTFSHDGTTLAAASDDGVFIWNLKFDEPQYRHLKGHFNKFSNVELSPDGNTLATASVENTIILWDLTLNEQKFWKMERGEQINSLYGHYDSISNLSFAPDGRILASASYDGIIILWDIDSGEKINSLEGHSEGIEKMVFSSNGQMLASASIDDSVILWDLAHYTQKYFKAPFNLEDVAFFEDRETLALATTDETIVLFDLKTKHQINIFNIDLDPEYIDITLLPDNNTLAVISAFGRTITFWDIKTGKPTNSFKKDFIMDNITFSPDGKTMAMVSNFGSSLIFDLLLQNKIKKADRLRASYARQTIIISDLETGEAINSFKCNFSIEDIAFSPDGRILAAISDDGKIVFWNREIEIEEQIDSLKGFSHDISNIIFSPDSQTLAATSDDGTIILYDLNNGQLNFLEGHSGKISFTAFSPDSTTLATASFYGGNISLWNLEEGEMINSLKGHDSVEGIAFSIDGKTMISVYSDGSIINWDFSKIKELANSSAKINIDLDLDLGSNREGLTIKPKYNNTKNLYRNKQPNFPQWSEVHPFHWLKKAKGGDSNAMLQLGIIYERDNNFSEALTWYKKSAETENASAKKRYITLKNYIENFL